MTKVGSSVTRFTGVVVVSVVVAGCWDSACREAGAKRSARDVAFFLANPVERQAKIAACQGALHEAVFDPECQNARTALAEPETSPKPDSRVRDVPFYLANPDEMRVKLATCRDNPGGALLDAECLNARAASTRRATDPSNTTMPGIGGSF